MVAMAKNKMNRFLSCSDMAGALGGIWPPYIRFKEPLFSKVASLLKGIFEERMFLPGMTLISILVSFMVFQQIYIKTPLRLKPYLKFLTPPPEHSTSLTPPLPEKKIKPPALPPKAIKEEPAKVLPPEPHPAEEDLKKIESLLDSGDIENAAELIQNLKLRFNDSQRLGDLGKKQEKLLGKREGLSRFEDLIRQGDYGEALATLDSLRLLFPEDSALKEKRNSTERLLERENEKKKMLSKLQALKEKQDLEKLKDYAKECLDSYPEENEMKEFLQFSEKKLLEIQKEEACKKEIEGIRKLAETGHLGEALDRSRQSKSLYPERSELTELQKEIERKINEESLLSNLKQEEKTVAGRIEKLSSAFTGKNLQAYEELLNGEDKPFYGKENESAKNLFQMTRTLSSSVSILKIYVEGDKAKVSIFWKLSAVFLESSESSSLFEKQVDVLFENKGNQWLITGYSWIK